MIVCYNPAIKKKEVINVQWNLPGTVLSGTTEQADNVADTFRALYLAGDLQLSQVSAISGLEAYMIQNWVRRGYLSPPVGKKYSLNQLCRILNINLMRSCFPLEKVCTVLSYVNGKLDDTSDDLIEDSALYFLFVSLAASVRDQNDGLEKAIQTALRDLPEGMPGANERIQKVLKTMLLAWISGELSRRAEELTTEMEREEP